ncbi:MULTISPECIES: response regulator transcription factor [unclassified Rathayibacter]|jgi:DNA-binding response OmpR family regulator|uniref:response regulator transcription factor n=1 Tax=unclassified Rathayibacter TaxID=2609250 RepID=UPI000CE8CBF0|nr:MULTISPECIES: response regulator transcription factor [unclassified Rathayibacter]PPF18392.1 DNA-binding response regulator [Rathayibacter sp. AY1A4]PPG59745.1 DNA-binding response regulator [Rathayibacter sp. AY2B7]PPG81486.1 DNA-binding response regulator [Rathayibacter sp. AY1E5]PPG90470.1 DNA-binding response regulator [Rathayibacter sp. AY1F3]PPH32258.1 DNA-binding response regulator [Rathayibacter sp. AY1C3]
MRESVIVVEDDVEMGELIRRGLTGDGYDVALFSNGVDALNAAREADYAAAVLDVMLPGMSGFEICRHLRATGATLPVIMLTARDALQDRVFGLDAGADDYLAKPFHFEELSARLRAMIRREHLTNRVPVVLGNLRVDPYAHAAFVDDSMLPLSPKEFGVLRALAVRAGEFMPREEILLEVWGSAEFVDHNIAEQYISYLRRKLSAGGASVEIVTRRGAGYRLGVKP